MTKGVIPAYNRYIVKSHIKILKKKVKYYNNDLFLLEFKFTI